jgi:hypothetical protein
MVILRPDCKFRDDTHQFVPPADIGQLAAFRRTGTLSSDGQSLGFA